jgi:thiosulfate/3-mercaptopyruvate sulfurtransferase
MAEYAHPEVLVSTDWLTQHLNDSGIRIIEVDVDTSAYEQGHIRGAVGWNWQTQLSDQVRRVRALDERLRRHPGHDADLLRR